LKLTKEQLDRIAVWAHRPIPLLGVFFHSVSYRYMDPEKVLDGMGTAAVGGRFASVGTRAVYLAESDAVASQEVTARKRRLGGAAQVTLDKYPRVTFAVTCSLDRVVDLASKPLPRGLAPIRDACLDEDLSASVEVGDALKARAVQGLIFPSAIGTARI
jgi:RES domain-containing protein